MLHSAESKRWVLLVYKIPHQPSRLRLQVWRRLQKMGVIYLQDAVCILPWRPELVENMEYVTGTVEEMGGSCHLFAAEALLPNGDQRLVDSFISLADERLKEIAYRLAGVQDALESASALDEVEAVEEDLKKERVAYLRGQRMAYFGSIQAGEVERRLDRIREALDGLHRNQK
jgi:hypothetical protein